MTLFAKHLVIPPPCGRWSAKTIHTRPASLKNSPGNVFIVGSKINGYLETLRRSLTYPIISSEVEKQANSALDSGSRRGSANEKGNYRCDNLSRTGAAIIEGSTPSLTANFHDSSSVPCFHRAEVTPHSSGTYQTRCRSIKPASRSSGHVLEPLWPFHREQSNSPRNATHPELPPLVSALSHHLSQV